MAAGIKVATNLEEVVIKIVCAVQIIKPLVVWRAVGSCILIRDMSWLNIVGG